MAAVGGAAALFLTLTAAFGMEPVPAWKRLAYWLLTLGLGSAASLAGRAWAARASGGRLLLRLAILTAAISALMTPVVYVATRLLFGLGLGDGWSWRGAAGFAGPVLLVSAAMVALTALASGAHRAPEDAASTPSASGPPPAPAATPPRVAARFRERLPVRLREADIYAVEAEDHYLRVHTGRGSDLLLMRLADALEELDGVDGARTHRSWWVARAAVADARRGDGRATLVLKDGTEAPVSRSYAPALREAGWF